MTHNEEISRLRKEYSLSRLFEQDMNADPIMEFHKWFKQAVKAEITEPNAMCLSTSANGQPDSRIVLLKGVEHHGFVFYSNYLSSKGRQISENPKVHLNFAWLELERQVRIKGIAEKVSVEDSEAYFHSRPFESRIAAIVSTQSEKLESRDQLDKIMQQALEFHNGKEPQRPEHWGGYLVKPFEFEFWQGRPGRLHDRILYKQYGKQWEISRLFP